MIYFIHVANVVYLASYAVKDIVWLRCLTILGILLCIPYYLAFLRYEAALWSLVFLAINVTRLVAASKKRPCEEVPIQKAQS